MSRLLIVVSLSLTVKSDTLLGRRQDFPKSHKILCIFVILYVGSIIFIMTRVIMNIFVIVRLAQKYNICWRAWWRNIRASVLRRRFFLYVKGLLPCIASVTGTRPYGWSREILGCCGPNFSSNLRVSYFLNIIW